MSTAKVIENDKNKDISLVYIFPWLKSIFSSTKSISTYHKRNGNLNTNNVTVVPFYSGNDL